MGVKNIPARNLELSVGFSYIRKNITMSNKNLIQTERFPNRSNQD